MRLRLLAFLFKEIKETPENAQLTNMLVNSKGFRNFSLKVHSLKQSFWQKLDEAAFPEDYKANKYIDKK